MQSATSNIATVASTYASHVPFPASAQTSGIVATGVAVGAIVEMDCASVSIGDSASPPQSISVLLRMHLRCWPHSEVLLSLRQRLCAIRATNNTGAPISAQAPRAASEIS